MTIKELREVNEIEEVKDEEKDNAEARRRRERADGWGERRVGRLTFKIHNNTGVIGLSSVYLLGIRMKCGKEFERKTYVHPLLRKRRRGLAIAGLQRRPRQAMIEFLPGEDSTP